MDFLHHVAKHGVGGGNHIRLEFTDKVLDSSCQLREQGCHSLDDRRAAQHRECEFPEGWVVVDCRAVTRLDEAIHHRICAGVGIDHKHLGTIASSVQNRIPNVSRRRVVAFAHTGGQNQDS